MRVEFRESDGYRKDLKKLGKRFKTLPEDIETLKKVLDIEPDERPPMSARVGGLGVDEIIIKVKKIACRAMKTKGSNTGLRMIYCYKKEEAEIILIELYFKGDKENEDRERIKNWRKEEEKKL
jgi:hypothetical protein